MPADFLEILPIGVWVLDEELRVMAVNSKIQEFFGMPREPFLGQDKRKLVTEKIHTIFEDGEEFLRRILATYNQNTYAENFLVHVLPGENRQERWLEHFSQPVTHDGAIVGRVEIYFDVTDRIQFEQELNWISTQFIKVQEREKANIAGNLHNQVGQSVIALKLALERFQSSLRECVTPMLTQQMDAIVSHVEGIAREISQISNDLLPPELNTFGIQETLNWMQSYYKSIFGLTIEGQILGINDKRFKPEVEIALFRFFQEGLNNVIKHAGVNSVEYKLIYSYPRIIAVVADHGVGFDPDKKKLGVGLRIMQRRIAELGGTLTIKSKENEGTQIRAVIPYNGSTSSHLDAYDSKRLDSVRNRFAVTITDADDD